MVRGMILMKNITENNILKIYRNDGSQIYKSRLLNSCKEIFL
jgi:hypothetical protein